MGLCRSPRLPPRNCSRTFLSTHRSITFELTTPTGAAIISTLGTSFGPLPQMKVDRIAYGAGDRDFPGQPNVLRLMIGERVSAYEEDTSIVIETNIDDMNPQVYDYLIGKLMAEAPRTST